MEYRIISSGECKYIKYKFAGGATEREKDPAYPRSGNPYCVEQARIWSPYIKIYDCDYKNAQKQYIRNGMLATTDPGLRWKRILSPYYGIIDLPIEGTIALNDNIDAENLQIVFGYGKIEIQGYCMQTEENVEFVFNGNTGKLSYAGTAWDKAFISVESPSDKRAVLEIGGGIKCRDEVKEHLIKNHYFDEKETI